MDESIIKIGHFCRSSSRSIYRCRLQRVFSDWRVLWADNSATASVDITIVPEAPSDLVADGTVGGPQAIELTWDHSLPLPSANSGFGIELSHHCIRPEL
jgi:hypothetical protein